MPEPKDELSRFFTLCQDMLCIADTDGYFRRVNPSWTRITGWSEAELLAAPYLDFVHPDDRAATIREAAAIAAGHVTVSFDNRYRCRDGSYKWLQWTSVLFTEDQQIYGTARDVTVLKTTEMALREAHDQAARATRAKSEFLSRMSHDLRTPLNAIMGFAQVLQLDALSPEQTDSVAHVLRGGRHLLEMINEVLDISRIEAGRLSLSLEPVSLADVACEAVALMGPLAAQRGITITTPDFGEIAVLADRQRLTQILLNLLGNAVKYNRDGGRVNVSARVEGTTRVSIAITDTGAGIPAD
jgi:PAS domain S-box-containing protein